MRPDTLLVHAGEPRPRNGGAVTMPIYQSSTFEESEARGYHDIRYARLSNTPSHEALHAKLAALEGAEAALATASGMAAISATLFSTLRAGDHVLAQDGLYGGTHDLLTRDLPRLGIEVTFVPGDDPAAWSKGGHFTNAPVLCGGDDQPAGADRRPAGRANLRARARPDLRHRQHLRHPARVPAPPARLRPGRAQRYQVPERPQRPDRRRRDGRCGPRAGGETHARSPGRLARSARLLPAAARAVPRGAPRGGARQPPGAGEPSAARAGARAVRLLRRHAQLRAQGRRRGGRADVLAVHPAAARSQPGRSRDPGDAPGGNLSRRSRAGRP